MVECAIYEGQEYAKIIRSYYVKDGVTFFILEDYTQVGLYE
jgi:hypothetical protein